jgi:hypothetical protein
MGLHASNVSYSDIYKRERSAITVSGSLMEWCLWLSVSISRGIILGVVSVHVKITLERLSSHVYERNVRPERDSQN